MPGFPCALRFRSGLIGVQNSGALCREARGFAARIGRGSVNRKKLFERLAMSPHCRKRLLSQAIISNVSIRWGQRIGAVMELSSESGKRAHGK
jgi:hypothetical protein